VLVTEPSGPTPGPTWLGLAGLDDGHAAGKSRPGSLKVGGARCLPFIQVLPIICVLFGFEACGGPSRARPVLRLRVVLATATPQCRCTAGGHVPSPRACIGLVFDARDAGLTSFNRAGSPGGGRKATWTFPACPGDLCGAVLQHRLAAARRYPGGLFAPMLTTGAGCPWPWADAVLNIEAK